MGAFKPKASNCVRYFAILVNRLNSQVLIWFVNSIPFTDDDIMFWTYTLKEEKGQDKKEEISKRK